MNHQPTAALYYPFLTMNEHWLKSGLLYWEHIHRIVPQELVSDLQQSQDTPAVREATAAGLLLPLQPRSYLDAAATRFRTTIFPLLRDPRPEVSNNVEGLFPISTPSRCLNWVHERKISILLLDELEAEGLVTKVGDRIHLPEQVAALYLSSLAAEMSSRTGSPLITDTADFVGGGKYMLFGQPPQATSTAGRASLLAQIGIDFPTPKSVAACSIDQIITFRQKRAGERFRFRKAIEAIAQAASEMKDPVALNDYLSGQRGEIATAIDDHRRALDEIKVKCVASALGLSVPTALAPGLLVKTMGLDPTVSMVAAAVGVAVNVVAWWAGHRNTSRDAIVKCPWHYALTLHSEFPQVN